MNKLPPSCVSHFPEKSLCNFCGSEVKSLMALSHRHDWEEEYDCDCEGSSKSAQLGLTFYELQVSCEEAGRALQKLRAAKHSKVIEEELKKSIKDLQKDFGGYSITYNKDI